MSIIGLNMTLAAPKGTICMLLLWDKTHGTHHLAKRDVLPPRLLLHLFRLHEGAQVVHLLEQVLVASASEGLGCAAGLCFGWRAKGTAPPHLPKWCGWLTCSPQT